MTKKTDRWMPLYIEAYDRATNRLSLAEDGAYLRLLRDYWINGPPPDDDVALARILRIDRREWAKIKPALLPFFTIDAGRWLNKRADDESAKAVAILEKRREAGAQGGRPRKHEESKPEANGFANENLEGEQTGTPARVALPLPLPLRVVPSEPVERTKPSVSGQAARGTRLSPDWLPGVDHVSYAVDHGFAAPAILRMADDFRDYWTAKPGKDGAKTDWMATWRRWVRTQAERPKGRPGPAPASKRVGFV